MSRITLSATDDGKTTIRHETGSITIDDTEAKKLRCELTSITNPRSVRNLVRQNLRRILANSMRHNLVKTSPFEPEPHILLRFSKKRTKPVFVAEYFIHLSNSQHDLARKYFRNAACKMSGSRDCGHILMAHALKTQATDGPRSSTNHERSHLTDQLLIDDDNHD